MKKITILLAMVFFAGSIFAQTEKIYDTCLSILNASEQQNIPAQQAAIEAAKARIEAIGRLKLPF